MSLRTVKPTAKYGLQKKKTNAKKIPTANKVAAFFSQDDDEEEEERSGDIVRANKQLTKQSTDIETLRKSLSEEEAKLYDYDGSYDEFKAASTNRLLAASGSLLGEDKKKSQYISKLKATAAVREKEKDRIYERRLLKERQQEDAEFGDKPKFVTSAYKQKLMEDRKWEYEDRIADEVEKRTGAESRGMHGFFSNLLTKNIAMGGDVQHAVSAYTAGSDRQRRRMEEEDISPVEKVDSPKQPNQDSMSPKSNTVESNRSPASEKDVNESAEPPTQCVGTKRTIEEATATDSADIEKETEPVKKTPPAASVISKEEAIRAAKERYLARKKTAA